MHAIVQHLTLRRTLAVALAVAVLAAAVGVGVVAAKKPSCRSTIAGTYYTPHNSILNLSADGTLTGTLSQTSQAISGPGETFLGMWQCDGTSISAHDFRWVDNVPRQVSRFDWDGRFTPDDGGTLTVHFAFTHIDESSTAEQLRTAENTSTRSEERRLG